jgi:hypothetical protein
MIDYALTTKERVKARIDITVAGLDTVIETFIASATGYIELLCGGRRFKETTYTNEVYDGSLLGTNSPALPYLILKNAPVSALSSFQYRNGTRTNPVWTDFQADNYEPLNARGIIRADLPSGLQNIRVTYTAGYKIDFSDDDNIAVHTLPFELSDLCERMVIKRIKKRESEGKSQETLRDSTINWGSFVDSEDKDIITRYRRVTIV